MKSTHLYNRIFVQPLFFAFLGVLFCFWNRVDPSSVPCVSSGCELFQNGAERPVLWLLGCIGFFVLMLCALFKKPNIGRFCAGFGLSLDIILFFIMVLTLPCIICVLTGLLLALCYRAFFIKTVTPQLGQDPYILKRSFLLLLWTILFIVNVGLIIKSFVTPWSLNGDKENKAHAIAIFFSPSCPACKKLVRTIPEPKIESIDWYPVMERGQDFEAIAMLQLLFIDKVVPLSEALDIASKAPPLTFFERISFRYLLLQFRLWVNSAHVLSSGDGRLPFLEFRGIPESLVDTKLKTQTGNKDASLPLELEATGICGEKGGIPCGD